MHWSTEFYEKLDRGDPGMAAMMAPDILAQVGNVPETRGLEAMMAGELGRHHQLSPTCTHKFLAIWDLDPDTAALDSIVTYHRIDGRDVTVPVLTIVHRNKAGLIDSLRLFLDNSPLFKDIPPANFIEK